MVTLNVDTGGNGQDSFRVPSAVQTNHRLLLNPTNKMVAEVQSKDLQTGAGALGIQLRLLNASTERDFEDVFASLKQMQVGGLVIGTDGFFVSESERLAALSGPQRNAGDLPISCVCSRRRVNELWKQCHGLL